MAASTAQLGNLSITTKVVPGSENTAGLSTVPSTPNWVHVLAQKKKQPFKSLSAVMILIGALQLSIGVSMSAAEDKYPSLVSRSGIPYVGSITFIAAGIITVVFESEENIYKIKICIVSHLISAMFAVIGIILYAIQVYTDTQACWVELNGDHKKCNSSAKYESRDSYYYYRWDYSEYVSPLRISVNSLILFYITVGFVISSCIIMLRWKSLKKAKYNLLGS